MAPINSGTRFGPSGSPVAQCLVDVVSPLSIRGSQRGDELRVGQIRTVKHPFETQRPEKLRRLACSFNEIKGEWIEPDALPP